VKRAVIKHAHSDTRLLADDSTHFSTMAWHNHLQPGFAGSVRKLPGRAREARPRLLSRDPRLLIVLPPGPASPAARLCLAARSASRPAPAHAPATRHPRTLAHISTSDEFDIASRPGRLRSARRCPCTSLLAAGTRRPTANTHHFARLIRSAIQFDCLDHFRAHLESYAALQKWIDKTSRD